MFDDSLTDSARPFRLTPLTIITLYVLCGSAWIGITSLFHLRFSSSVSSLVPVDLLEESAFLVLTAVGALLRGPGMTLLVPGGILP